MPRKDWPAHPVPEHLGPLKLSPGVMSRSSLSAGRAGPIPLIVYAGASPGPILYVQALQHGLELNGCDVMRRLIQTLDPATMTGTLILVPMANPLAARVHMQSFPYPDRPTQRHINDMNRRWFPEHGNTNHVDLMVEALKPAIALADACIDLHCHEHLYPAMALTDMTDSTCAALALAMGFETVRSGKGVAGMFGPYVRDELGKVGVTVEMPPLRRVDHANSMRGYRGVLNAMRFMGMLAGALELPGETAIFGTEPQKGHTAVAEQEGFMSRYAAGGNFVHKGDVVADIWSPDDFSVVQAIEAPFDSYIISIGRPPQIWGEPEHDYMNIGDRAVTFSTASKVIIR